MTEMGVTGGYVRHRDRMIQESIFEDLSNTLIACGWKTGAVTRSVHTPDGALLNVGDTVPTLPLIGSNPITLIDYFPEAEGETATAGTGDGKTAPNTLAMSTGIRGESVPRELGSSAETVPYTFNMAFYAASDAVALAVLNDLTDRYRGRIVQDDTIDLWNYNTNDAFPVTRLDVEYFRFQLAADQSVVPYEVHLYFAELGLVDDVD